MKMLNLVYSNALKKYCKLDNLAMIAIWFHWQDLKTNTKQRHFNEIKVLSKFPENFPEIFETTLANTQLN